MALFDELYFAPARKLIAMLRAREISSTELTRAFYERIGSVNPKLNAVVTLCIAGRGGVGRARPRGPADWNSGGGARIWRGNRAGDREGARAATGGLSAAAAVRTRMIPVGYPNLTGVSFQSISLTAARVFFDTTALGLRFLRMAERPVIERLVIRACSQQAPNRIAIV